MWKGADIMQLSKSQYTEMYKEASAGSKAYINVPKAFVIGGLICMLGEYLRTLYGGMGLDDTDKGIATSVTLIFLSALMTGLGLYSKLAKHGGAGTLVPITGFANSVVAPAVEFKAEGFVLGLGAKIFIISGPVILYGTLASAVYGVIYWLMTL